MATKMLLVYELYYDQIIIIIEILLYYTLTKQVL